MTGTICRGYDTPLRKRVDLWTSLSIVSWIAHGLLIWMYRFVPSVDYPQWLLQANILSTAGSFSQSECYRLLLFPIPNGGFVLPVALLTNLVPVEVAGKIVLTLYLMLFPLAVRQLSRSVGNTSDSWLLSVLILFNVSFVYGNIAFLVGVVALFFSFAWMNQKILQQETSWRPAALAGIAIALFLAHAVPALIFILFATVLLITRRVRSGGKALSVVIGIIAALGVWYSVARVGSLTSGTFRWEVLSSYRVSLIAKSFVAGWSFDPDDNWLLRAPATALVLTTVGAISYFVIHRTVKMGVRNAVEALALVLAGLCMVAPISMFGISEIPQRVAFVSGSLFIALTVSEKRTARVLLMATITLTTIVRVRDYSSSSELIGQRYTFLARVLPPDPTLLVLGDVGQTRSEKSTPLVPRGLHFIFQSDYNLLRGGCTPQMFHTGYVVSADCVGQQALDSLLAKTTLPHLRGKDIPSSISHIVVDLSMNNKDSLQMSLRPEFCEIADTTFGKNIHTVVMERARIHHALSATPRSQYFDPHAETH